MSSKEVGIEDGRKNLGDYVIAAQQRGEITVITRYGKPAAAIVPIDRIREPFMATTPEPAMPVIGKVYRATHNHWGWPASRNILITETAPAAGEALARVRYRLAEEDSSEVWTYLRYFESLAEVLPEGTLCTRLPEHAKAGVLATSERYYSGKTKSGFIGFCDECAAMQDAIDKGV